MFDCFRNDFMFNGVAAPCDLAATHKIAGYASHTATSFCTWCECKRAEVGNLEIACVDESQIVKDHSREFKDEKNQSEADCLVKKSGIQWSELNCLPYWDPVQQTSIGIMHMWFEGILQTHFVNRWHFTFPISQERDFRSEALLSSSNDLRELDKPHQISGLYPAQLMKMKALLTEVVLPSGITNVPRSIGTLKGGKIKASKWQSLFSIYLPLVVMDVFLEDVELYESNLPLNQ
ncbi:hypothetical protein O181_101051 [Austropuccinia psidii MF-1]|uniref:Uncharacterized protein n=1 Tax=Austropuccinia psidii MF-1 TaxID=1389203 RepID=A0A9Q3PIB2_9BASI|nr:hypothetical protein [Austropuccinia psidii MF-1]